MNAAPTSQLYRAARATAWIAGVFLIGVSGTMLYQRFTADSNDPWKSPQLLELKEQLRAAPKDERIKERIRELDLKFRQRYVRRLHMVKTGGWLLLGGSVVLLVALSTAAGCRKTMPSPQPDPGAGDRALREAAQSRRAVAVTGGLVFAGLGVVVMSVRTSLSDTPAVPGGALPAAAAGAAGAASATPVAGAPVPAVPPLAEFMANWPRFLGPTGSSVAASAEVPWRWDEAAKTGIAWKVPVPVAGFNSPIVWGNRIFLSGGTREQREVVCYDTADGKLLWRRVIEKVPGSPAQAPKISDQTGYASPTMATDGRFAFVIFATGDLAALSFDGAVVWSKHLGVPKNMYGHATSLAAWQGRLLVQYDQGESGPANSRLMAFDGATGRIVWEKPRAIPSSWASPIVVEAAGKTQVITLGEPFVISYDWTDGTELWKAHVLEGEVTPSPAFAGGLVLALNPYNSLLALKPDGTGDVTESHVKWKAEGHIPDVSSPVSAAGLVFTVTSDGALMCFDLGTGEKVWEHELKAEVQATPAIAGNRLYVPCTDGVTVVVEVGRVFKELARNPLTGRFVASPAFARGRIYVRSLDHLYCLAGETAQPAGP